MKKIVSIIGLLLFVLGSQISVAQNTIEGYVFYHANPDIPVPDVNVGLYTVNGALLATSMTGTSGHYQFTNVQDGTYVLSSTTTIAPGGIDMNDAFLILLHIMGLYEFTPIQFLAADVTGNGVVNFADYFFVVFYYFIHGQPFPAGSWVFEDLVVTTASRDGGNVAGSSTGDVQGIWVPTGRDLYQEDKSIGFQGELSIMPYETATFTVRSNSLYEIAGYGLVFDFNPDELSIVDVVPYGENANYAVKDGQIRIGWINEAIGERQTYAGELATITVRANNSSCDKAKFELNETSHILDMNGDRMEYFELTSPTVKIKQTGDQPVTVFPSPAYDQATVRFTSSAVSAVDINVYSLNGQLVRNMTTNSNLGMNAINIPVYDLVPGIYNVTISQNQLAPQSIKLTVK